MDLPIKIVIFHSYLKLPEGFFWDHHPDLRGLFHHPTGGSFQDLLAMDAQIKSAIAVGDAQVAVKGLKHGGCSLYWIMDVTTFIDLFGGNMMEYVPNEICRN